MARLSFIQFQSDFLNKVSSFSWIILKNGTEDFTTKFLPRLQLRRQEFVLFRQGGALSWINFALLCDSDDASTNISRKHSMCAALLMYKGGARSFTPFQSVTES